MGGDIYSKYNNEKDVTINIESNKVCYFPGEIMSGTITLLPLLQPFEKIIANPKLNITITEFKYFSYSRQGGKHSSTVTRREEKNLVNTSIDFGALMTPDYSAGFKVPFSIQIPNDAYPTIKFTYKGHVKHYFIVELPDLNAKRTKMFVIKINFPNNVDNTLLRNMIEENKEYKKSKLFFNKGSCLLNIKMPKNYFFYNEKIPLVINLDCSNLKMEIKSIRISLFRKPRKNNYKDYSKTEVCISGEIINQKLIDLEKGLNNYHISDFIEFPTTSDYNSVYPPKVYSSFDEYGLLELNDSNFSFYLFPSTVNGLLTVDYFINLKIYFNSSLTIDEEFSVPIYFSSNIENNNNMNPMYNQGYSSSIPYVSSNNIYYNNNNINAILFLNKII